MRVDAHHHLWCYEREAFAWIDPKSRIASTFSPDIFRDVLKSAGVDGAIAVQARQIAEETDFLVAAAKVAPILGVVGWIDLRSADIEARLVQAAHPLIVGYRHVVQDEPDDDFLLQPSFVHGVQAVMRQRLAYDLLVNSRQLRSVPSFLDKVGQGQFVLDHAAKPDIASGGWQPWANEIASIAANPSVVCKISGLVTEADHQHWRADDLERYLDHIFSCFGPGRLLWGSDWPVCLLASSYIGWLDLVDDYVLRNCPDAHAAIFGKNALRAYNVKVSEE